MLKAPTSCEGCFHNAGMGVCMKDPAACRADGYSGYRFRDFVHLAEYVTKHDIRCFRATNDEGGGIYLEVGTEWLL